MKNIHNITAGAGAGKTTELVNVICRLLSCQENRPERMILTTFTKAAAAEFRERVKERLFASGRKDAAIAVDAAQMGTIDSIAETYISRYWYLLDMSPNLTPISKGESERLMEEALLEVVQDKEINFFHQYAESFSFTKSGADTGIDYDLWKTQFKEIARMKQEGILTLNDMDAWREKSKSLLAKTFVPTKDLSDFKRTADEYVAICEQYGKKDVIHGGSLKRVETQKGLINEFKCKDKLSVAELRQLLEAFKSPFSLKPKAQDEYGGALQDAFDSLTEAINAIVPAEASDISVFSDLIINIAIKGIEAYEAAKRNAGVIDFSDMEAGFLRLLDFDEVKSDISDSVDFLFVDEFQDCNAIQIAIFSKLSELVKQSWFVGDMKQAIYGFRGSDTELVVAFCKNFPESEKDESTLSHFKQNDEGLSSQILDTSYRSVPDLVDLTNKVFVEAFKTSYVNEVDGETFVYDKETITDEGRVCLEKHREKTGNHPVLFHANLLKENKSKTLPYNALATFVCSVLNGEYEPLKGVEIKPSDIAVLTRKNGHVVRIAAELQKKQIPAIAVDMDFKKSIEVAVLLDLLRLAAGIQTEKTRAELIYMLHSKTLRQSIESVRDKGEKELYLNGIESFAGSLRGLSMVDRVDALITRFDLYDFSSRWNNEDQRRENLDLVRQIAREFDQGCQVMGKSPDCRSFLAFINNYIPEPAFNNNTDGVKVLTCHKAKGLEWKVVILWQISGGKVKGKPDMVSGVTKDFYIAPVPEASWTEASVNKEPILRKIRLTNMAKALNEERRLLYVGVTRARDILITAGLDGADMETILSCCPSAPSPAIFDRDKSTALIWDKDIESVLVDVCNIPDSQYRNAKATADVPNPSLFPFPSVASPGDEKYRNPSKLEFPDVIARAKATIIPGMEGRMDISHPGLEDNEFGDCIHHIYAACCADAPEKSRAIASRTLMNWGIDDPSAPEKVVSSYEELCAFLASKYGKADGVSHEVPFMHQDTEGHVYSGVMDMLWETAAGVVIVDFKTFGGNKAEALKESVQKHSSQMHEYQEALTAARKNVLATVLFYPVTGVVIEVKTD